jgi:NAD(P)-dependent dehydrogenase (short-subunit alcohol dehydrogenase family)
VQFAGTTCLVTGAASGIGLATARHLAEQGAGRLILADRNASALEALRLRCDVVKRVGDVADPANWAEPLPPLDHAVINAGVPGVGPIVDMPFEEWRRVLAVNLDGVFLSLQAAMRAMRDGGSAVIVASAAGVKAAKGTGAYAASKAAVIQLARVAALEGAERRIRVNVIAPGGVESPIWHGTDWFRELESRLGREEAYRSLAQEGTPLGRFAIPEEIAAQIAFLLSNEVSGYTTGSVLITDGGYSVG